MPGHETRVEITGLSRAESGDPVLADSADISGGVSTAFDFVARSSVLYLDVASGTTITVEFSPDFGDTWREPVDPDLPLSYSGAQDDVVEIDYSATGIRLTANDSTSITAEVLAVP